MLIGITIITLDTVPLKKNYSLTVPAEVRAPILTSYQVKAESSDRRQALSEMSPPADEFRPRQSTGLGECNMMSQHKSWISYPIALFLDSNITGGLYHQ